MTSSGKKLRELDALLQKNNKIHIIKAIELLREDNPCEGVIGLLTAFYDKTDDIQIKKTIGSFMNDIKDQSVTKEVINEIKKQWKCNTISMLVSSCWQSGLDYSYYSNDLVEVFLKGDYITAIECFTVIEESLNKLTNKKKNEITRIIEEYPLSNSNEKNALSLELISLLERE